MLLFHTVKELREYKKDIKKNHSIAFVPTMGAIHRGHLSLVEIAKKHASNVGVSIFVNPTQFLPNEDFSRYPRNVEQDIDLLKQYHCDWVFLPSIKEMYPQNLELSVNVGYLSTIYEGAFRPQHFQGVATIVLKLLNIVQPDIAVFGKKDAQQCAVIQCMVNELFMNVKILFGDTVREANGLALSSRNQYLSGEEKEKAIGLYVALTQGRLAYLKDQNIKFAVSSMYQAIQPYQPTSVDYFAIVDRFTFLTPSNFENAIAIGAVRFGQTRLIDAMDIL